MNHKNLIGTAVAAALLFGAQAASACAISAWSSATNLTVADTGEPTSGFLRTSGRCSLRVADSNGAAGRFVTDTTPNNETSYRVRFYYFTGNITAGTADIFQARDTGNANVIRVTHDGNQLSFTTLNNGVATPAQTVTVADSRYYSIELNWSAAAGTGSMTGTVTGNSGSAFPAVVAGTVNFPNLNNAANSITEARMGLIAGSPTVGNPVFFDEFDSRRTQSPGRLCRGDSNGNGSITSADRGAITSELALPPTIAAGLPDCNETGTVSASDRSCVTALLAAFASCN